MMFQGSKSYDSDYFTPLQRGRQFDQWDHRPGSNLVFRDGA
ncbi:MAG: hypothetical protein IPG67_14785 [Acidobacteria bacterium]|nr:hypothetical protein [Acidobacteriota bacterium]